MLAPRSRPPRPGRWQLVATTTAAMLAVLLALSATASAQSPSGAPHASVASTAGTGTILDPCSPAAATTARPAGARRGAPRTASASGRAWARPTAVTTAPSSTCSTPRTSSATRRTSPPTTRTAARPGQGRGAGTTTPAPATAPPGNTRNAAGNYDTLYILVPLFSDPPPLQCNGEAVCIDHPGSLDLSALAPALGVGNPSSLYQAALPGHDHIVATRNGGLPEWWNVVVVGVTDPSAFAAIEAGQSVAAIDQ